MKQWSCVSRRWCSLRWGWMLRLHFAILLASLLAHPSAVAADAEEQDDRTVETVVFVGELISIETAPDPCEARRQAGDLSCISMDELYRARYRVVQPVVGSVSGPELTFNIADHYGFPRFAYFKNALLFVGMYDNGPWLHKYQAIPMHRTSEGQWAACGEVDHRRIEGRVPAHARPLRFEQPIASAREFSAEGWEIFLPNWRRTRDTYRIENGLVHCRKGIPVDEAYEIVRNGVMEAREVPLPPWPGH
jgi:hypothetical protein